MIFIAISGMIGVLSRYLFDKNFVPALSHDFPLSTFTINCVGSFLIGLVYVLSERTLLSKDISLALSVGFLGGFTTFSAFSLQTIQLIERKQISMAIAYVIGSPLLGVVAAAAGIGITRYFLRSS
ncbi:MAG: fluoride efflux transporter CrcB [Pseudobdellovibrionaceae bacterium]